ncbi:hypothetical protein D3C73_1588560 [compost metagenome]
MPKKHVFLINHVFGLIPQNFFRRTVEIRHFAVRVNDNNSVIILIDNGVQTLEYIAEMINHSVHRLGKRADLILRFE